jgi:hypothetical protein
MGGNKMLDLLIMFLVFTILVIGFTGMWIFATVMPKDVKDSEGNYLVKK